MKATRRGFLGLLGGAAAGGPSAAKSVVGPVTDAGGLVPLMTGLGSFPNADDETRIARVLKRLAGFRTPAEKERERLTRLESVLSAYSHEVDGLRSIAARHKVRMIRHRAEQIEEARQRYWWMDEIERLRGDDA